MSSPSERAHDPVTAWARNALDGKIVVGELVAAAAERHLKDLRDGPSRGLYWSAEAATRPLRFLPAMLSITEGAKVGEPFEPLPWHVFCAGSIFGWRRASGRLRYRSGWLETGKGQAKSPLMAGIGIYMAGFYGIERANPAMFRAVSLISNSIGMLPLHLKNQETKKKATEHPLFKVLHRKPNSFQSSFDFRAMMQLRALVHKNAYALVLRSTSIRTGKKTITGLVPLDPRRMTVKVLPDWKLD